MNFSFKFEEYQSEFREKKKVILSEVRTRRIIDMENGVKGQSEVTAIIGEATSKT